METTVDEIAPDIFRCSTVIAEVAPGGFSFNQFVVRAEAPFLFHTGMRGLFPLVSTTGGGAAISVDDLVGNAATTEAMFGATSLGPLVGATLRRLAELEPETLAVMHGPSFRGDGGSALRALAAKYDELAAAAAM